MQSLLRAHNTNRHRSLSRIVTPQPPDCAANLRS
jgi:hypothetical protein